MGRKAKLGKSRKDRFYHLAKEAGYRARSAFKLIQLNRKHHFLQSCRVLVDLCAAPGGWLQVAAKFMPVSSLIIGIDLVPIKSISNVITLQEDITTARCKQALQRELKTWKVDCMLNDGAPNVGSAWVQDAFTQAELSLSAIKLATQFLREGGWFITKVFRSKDYQPLIWVLDQLFKKVSATKPQASRSESAEIFVVCQGFIAPSKIDPKLLDPRYVFEDVADNEKEQKISLTKLQKVPKAEGYPDDARTLYKTTSVADFITQDDYLQILGSTNKLEFDKMSEVFSKHPLTTEEIRQNCEDIKVLGTSELKVLVKWREKLKQFLDSVDIDPPTNDEVVDKTQEKIEQLANEEAAVVKRERRKLRAMKRKLKERLVKNRSANDESGEIIRQEHLFKLGDIKTKAQLESIAVLSEEESQSDSSNESDQSDESTDNEDVSCNQIEETANPLIVSLDQSKQSNMWFSKTEFTSLTNDRDEDLELQQMVQHHMPQQSDHVTQQSDHVTPMSEDSDDSGEEEQLITEAKLNFAKNKLNDPDAVDTIEVVPGVKRKLDPEGLALGTLMIQSKKKREELIEGGYNRWTSNDDGLPDWFIADEAKFCTKQVTISQDMVDQYRSKLKEINSRPIKKIVEAKARKKKRTLKKMEKVRKKAEMITDSADVSTHEQAQQLRHMYRKAALTDKKKEVKYVVAKKRNASKRMARPAGVKGHYKVVDPRMKKDSRSTKRNKTKK